ncbi:CAAX prenyl protease-like protein [Lachnotalea glycerini]|uniref:CAAX prenyl protease-like protein n=1 Tax=Lachnotalea glycerini TaxID=1763509 RepID=A0A255I635_9FIRM|nr:CPBP family intramembrane glutamic endopeptidase [Lachnotalea glycerini]PXV93715.1 CAAX prenyl protease-like protein [Lachnotalea glycerini]RDY32657.1 CPBP family intramembrane metalloprotease [Lachnotalea glycerini]
MENSNSSNHLSKKIDILFGIIITILPVIYSDVFGLLPIISVLSIVYLVSGYKEQESNSYNLHVKYILMLMISIIAVYFLYYMITTGKWSLGIIILHQIIVLPTYAMLPVYLIPFVWMYFQGGDCLKNSFLLNKETSKITFLILIVFFYINLARIPIYLHERGTVSDTLAIHMVVQAFFVAAVAEELFFRGYIYGIVKKMFSTKSAQHISALIFIFSHINLLIKSMHYGFSFQILCNYISIYVLGFACAFIYEQTKSLVPCIILHTCIDGAIKYIFILVINQII